MVLVALLLSAWPAAPLDALHTELPSSWAPPLRPSRSTPLCFLFPRVLRLCGGVSLKYYRVLGKSSK